MTEDTTPYETAFPPVSTSTREAETVTEHRAMKVVDTGYLWSIRCECNRTFTRNDLPEAVDQYALHVVEIIRAASVPSEARPQPETEGRDTCVSNNDPQPYQTRSLVPVVIDGREVGIDACIAPTIAALADAQIGTQSSCCGHGETYPSVVLTSPHDALRAAEVISTVDGRQWEVKAWTLSTMAVARPQPEGVEETQRFYDALGLGEYTSVPESPETPEEEPRGDGPCIDCGTTDNPIWFAPSPFWNVVMGPDDRYAIVCPSCFIKRVYRAGFRPQAFEIRPDWPWVQADVAQRTEQGVPNPEVAGSSPAVGSTGAPEEEPLCEEVGCEHPATAHPNRGGNDEHCFRCAGIGRWNWWHPFRARPQEVDEGEWRRVGDDGSWSVWERSDGRKHEVRTAVEQTIASRAAAEAEARAVEWKKAYRDRTVELTGAEEERDRLRAALEEIGRGDWDSRLSLREYARRALWPSEVE